MYKTYSVFYFLIVQSCAYLFCNSICNDTKDSEKHSIITRALFDLLHQDDFITHTYLTYDNENDILDWTSILSNAKLKFEIYEYSQIGTLQSHIAYKDNTFLIIYESQNITNFVQQENLMWNCLSNVLFISPNTNTSEDISNGLMDYEILLPHPSRNNQALLKQYSDGKMNIVGVWTHSSG